MKSLQACDGHLGPVYIVVDYQIRCSLQSPTIGYLSNYEQVMATSLGPAHRLQSYSVWCKETEHVATANLGSHEVNDLAGVQSDIFIACYILVFVIRQEITY